MDSIFLFFFWIHSLKTVVWVEVVVASPLDPSFSLLDPPVVVWFQGAVLDSRFVDLPWCPGGFEPSTQRLESSRAPSSRRRVSPRGLSGACWSFNYRRMEFQWSVP